MNSELKQKYSDWSPFRYETNCILACAEYGNITKAAERVGLTQASLTKVLQKTELSLGYKIFLRNPRGVQLTVAGQSLIESIKKAQTHWNRNSFTQENEELVGLSKIIIGAHNSIANTTFPKIFKTLFSVHPETEFQFKFKRSVEITQKVAKSEIDIGLVISPIKNSELIVKHLSHEYIAVWGSKKNASDIVLYSSDMFLSEKILKTIKNKRLVMMNDYETIANMVLHSNLSALLPSTVAERFNFFPQSGKLYTVELSLIYRRDRFYTKNQKTFISNFFQLAQGS
jgi:DNA-binding transcriptional LysR family regulator